MSATSSDCIPLNRTVGTNRLLEVNSTECDEGYSLAY